MAEENVNVGDEQKDSNRTFTQSDFDKMVAKKEKEIVERYKDYETLKQKADALEKVQMEQEQAKLSEVEKANKRAQDLETRLAQIEQEKNLLAKTTLKLSVLSDPKYGVLPEPYKKVIDGEDEAGMKDSAEKALDDFTATLKKLGYKPTASGLPPETMNTIPAKPEDPIVTAFKKRFQGK